MLLQEKVKGAIKFVDDHKVEIIVTTVGLAGTVCLKNLYNVGYANGYANAGKDMLNWVKGIDITTYDKCMCKLGDAALKSI